MEWFWLAIIATTMFGIQSFLYKEATEKGCNNFFVTLIFMITVELLALFTFWLKGINFIYLSITLILGCLFAVFFFLKTIGQLKALEYLPTNKVFPITSSGMILAVLYALLFFQESLELKQILGIVVIVSAVILIHQKAKNEHNYQQKKIGFLIALLAAVMSGAMEIINKYAALSTNLNLFIIVTYLFGILISATSYTASRGQSQKVNNIKNSVKIGILIGLVNFIGYSASLSAMTRGPLSLIAPILAFCVMITVILAKLVYHEELSTKQLSLVILSITGVILLK